MPVGPRIELQLAVHQLRELVRDCQPEPAAGGAGCRPRGRSARRGAAAARPAHRARRRRSRAPPGFLRRARRSGYSCRTACARARSRRSRGRCAAPDPGRRRRPRSRWCRPRACGRRRAPPRRTRGRAGPPWPPGRPARSPTGMRPASSRVRSSRSAVSRVEPLHLVAHRLDEVLAGGLVERLVLEQLERGAEREDRRAQLVRRVGDERAPSVVERREAAAHVLERLGQLVQLVRAVVDDRLVELPVRDAVGGALQPPDPPCVHRRGGEADADGHQQADQTGKQDPAPNRAGCRRARSGSTSR